MRYVLVLAASAPKEPPRKRFGFSGASRDGAFNASRRQRLRPTVGFLRFGALLFALVPVVVSVAATGALVFLFSQLWR